MATRALMTAVLGLALAGCLGGGGPSDAPPPDRPSDLARDTLDAGLESFRTHQFSNARLLFNRAYQEYRSYDDTGGMVAAQMNLAEIDLLVGETEAAGARLARSRELVEGDRLTQYAARLAYMEARQAQQAGDADRAWDRIDAARAPLTEESPQSDLMGLMLDLLAADLLIAADPDEAALAISDLEARTVESHDLIRARVHRLAADLARDRDDAAGAEARYGAALDAYRLAEYRPGIAATHEAWAVLYESREAWERVDHHLSRALSVRLWMSDRAHTAADLGRLADAADALGDADRASRFRQVRDYLRGDSTVDWATVQVALAGF